MKKFKSKDELFSFIDDELAYRRLEIHYLKSILRSKKDSKEARVLIKSLVIISYSHWEGFVKTISSAYLSYVSFLSLEKGILSNDLLSSCLVLGIEQEKGLKCKIELMKSIICDNKYKPKINIDKMCDVESNLNSEVFGKIAASIGVTTNEIDSKYLFIDGSLLSHRNKYAHGEYCGIDVERAIEIADSTLELMIIYKNKIENMLAMNTFKKNNDN